MSEKVIQTRIINKNSALADWLAGKFNQEDFIDPADRLKKGEIALAYIETAKPDADGNLKNVPVYLMKIGDGTSAFSELEWLSAPASDVYAWAKATEISYDQGILTLKNGAKDGSDLKFNFKENFYTQEEVDALLSQKADIEHGKHLVWSKSTPLVNGAATVGVLEQAARADHVHPTDLSRAPLNHTHTAEDLPETMYPSPHTHNDIYFTKDTVNAFITDFSDRLQTKASITHNHSGSYATPSEVETLCRQLAQEYLSQIGRTFKFKGVVATTQELPLADENNLGDVWNISTDCSAIDELPEVSAGSCVAWNTKSWVVLSTTVDLLDFYTKVEANELFTNKPAFSKIKIGEGSTLTASIPEDILTIVPSYNIKFTPDVASNKLTIEAINTHYITSIYAGKTGLVNTGTNNNQLTENPFIKIFDDTTFRNEIQLKGNIEQDNGIIKVASDSQGIITISAFPEEHTYIFDGGTALDCY